MSFVSGPAAGQVLRGTQLARLLGSWHGPGPDYAMLAATVRGLLTDGRLALGVRLPAERELADALAVSRTTVSAAYRVLRDSGHLTSRRGAGSWTSLPAGHRIATSGLWAPVEDIDMIDMGVAALAAPDQLAEAAAEAVRELPRYASSAGYYPTGLGELRAAVAAGFVARGLPTRPEQIMITSGVQHAFDLVQRLLLGAGQTALVESPTYPNVLAALGSRRSRIATIGVSADGWDGELLLSTLRQTRPRLAYLIPDFQNPTGALMDLALREQVVVAAHQLGTDLIIDESFVELALGPVAIPPPMASFDRHARVLTVGGLSKPYWGGLRIGWVRAPAPVVQRLAAVRVGTDMAGPVLDQLVGVRLMARANEVVPARRVQLARQRDALADALRANLPEWRFRLPDGGVTLWTELDAPVSTALARAAEDTGVRVAPGPRFGVDGTLERFMRLPFTLPEVELVEAVKRLAAARSDLDRTRRSPWSQPAVIA
jgi:DNA-binding transcriptional MocR family regulator